MDMMRAMTAADDLDTLAAHFKTLGLTGSEARSNAASNFFPMPS